LPDGEATFASPETDVFAWSATKRFKAPNSHRLVELTAAALGLAWMETDIAANRSERDALLDDKASRHHIFYQR
jgi:hypothetical protein